MSVPPRYAVQKDSTSHKVICSEDGGNTWASYCTPAKATEIESAKRIAEALNLLVEQEVAEQFRAEIEQAEFEGEA